MRGLPVVLAVLSGLAAPAAPAQTLEAHRFALANGMTVVLVPDHRVPVVTHMLWYAVGSADEEAGKSGLAHFFEHLMFKGTPVHPGDAYARAVEEAGGELNAFTSYDYTAYYATVGSEHLETIVGLEADRMVNLALTPQQVSVEREVIAEERRLRTDNDPEALLHEQAMAALFLNHRYGVPVIGWMHEIRAWTREDALAFYRRWYAPNNAVLLVAGDVSRERLEKLAAAHYAGIPRAAGAARSRPAEPPPLAARRVLMTDPRAGRPLWMRLYLAPARGKSGPDETAALEVLAEMLGGGPASFLYRRLVLELRVAAQVEAGYSPAALDPTTLVVTAVPVPGVPLARLEEAIDRELEAFASASTAAAQALRARDGTRGAALWVGSALMTGASLEEVAGWPARIAAVTLEQVRSAAREVLRAERSATALLKTGREGE